MLRQVNIMFNVSDGFARHRFSSAVFISVLLSACGGGGGDTSPTDQAGIEAAEQTKARAVADSTKPTISPSDPAFLPPDEAEITTIEYHGDSTVWGYRSGSGARVATPAPAAFAAALPSPARYVVRNKGVNSADACELLNGGNARYAQSWETYMAASDADIVIINHAINDQWRMGTDQYRSCLNSLAGIAKKHGKKVVFETPNPTRDSYPGGLDAYANTMKSVAAEHGAPVIDQYAYLMNHLNGNYLDVYSIIPDGLHPDEATYILKGRYAAEVFGKLGN
jgi:lysophospholipase L1-like esterase